MQAGQQPHLKLLPCRNQKLHLNVQARESLTDPAAANYYSAGNAERVAAARDKTRRKLTGSHSRNPSDTNPETPGITRPESCLVHLPMVF